MIKITSYPEKLFKAASHSSKKIKFKAGFFTFLIVCLPIVSLMLIIIPYLLQMVFINWALAIVDAIVMILGHIIIALTDTTYLLILNKIQNIEIDYNKCLKECLTNIPSLIFMVIFGIFVYFAVQGLIVNVI